MANKRPAPDTPAPKEDKAAKFKRLAVPRYKKCAMSIRNLAKLGSPNYDRNDAQVTNIYNGLVAELDTMREQLKPGSKTPTSDINISL
jgi:hypothetical protein